MAQSIDANKYPTGTYQAPSSITLHQIHEWIDEIERFPEQLKTAVLEMSDPELDTPYRTGGWTARQVIHHVADSHLNSYIRFKWTLTEEKPTIKAYNEKDWAILPEASQAPVSVSLALIEALHRRWVLVLRAMSEEDWQRSFIHPETGKELRLDWMAGLYAWHGRHHLGHILLVKNAA